MRFLHTATIVILVGFLAVPLVMAVPLQDEEQDEDEDRGWTFDSHIGAYRSDFGLIMKADPSVGYSFNRHLRAYAGMPVYFTRESATSTTPASAITGGIGNAYAGLGVSLSGPVLDYSATLEAAAPTGDESRGFSTGLYSLDWTNTFSHTFSSVMPYASAGLANTVSDTAFFVRPFSSHGLVGHFELGSYWYLTPPGSRPAISIGASGYSVRASGEQTIVSRIISRDQTGDTGGRGSGVFQTQVEIVGLAELANDEGFSTWLTVSPKSKFNFQVGYSRSARYDLDSVFFGIGFHVGR